MSARQGIHKWQRLECINMAAKCIAHIHITANLKAYWLSCLCYMSSSMQSVSRVLKHFSSTCIFSVAGIFLEHVPIM